MDKTKITKAFKELRTYGYTAKQNWKCCQTCGWSALTDEQAGRVVFYHAQDNNDLKRDGTCHLAWAGNRKEIVHILKKHGIKVLNDSKKDQENRIHIDLNEEVAI